MIACQTSTPRAEARPHPGLVFAQLELSSETEQEGLGTVPASDSNLEGPGQSTALLESLRVGRPGEFNTPRVALAPANQRLGSYRLIERLRGGSQAELWKALRTKPGVEVVALKILTADRARDTRRLVQFRREAELGTRLAGPSLLPVHEFGEAGGRAFMAMPLVTGGTLGDALAARRREPPDRPAIAGPWWSSLPDETFAQAMVRIVTRIARALEDVHERRVVHCDIKPANILLDHSRDDRAFLCDFGLGRHLDEHQPAPSHAGAGTPLYMAPEKLLGRDFDEVRCDLYSLGVTLFEAATLVHPFPLPRNIPRACLASYLATTVPPRPRSIRTEIPVALEAIIVRAMDPDPTRRYGSAGEMARDLERLATGPARAACG